MYDLPANKVGIGVLDSELLKFNVTSFEPLVGIIDEVMVNVQSPASYTCASLNVFAEGSYI